MSWKRTKCVVASCQATPEEFPDRKFLRFPKRNTGLYKKWLDAVDSKETVENRKIPYICSIHFRPQDFGKLYVKRHAYPSLQLTSSLSENVCDEINFDPSKVKRTYSRKMPASTDITPKELNALAKETFYSEETLEFTCASCLKKSKAVAFYIKLVAKQQKIIKQVRLAYKKKKNKN